MGGGEGRECFTHLGKRERGEAGDRGRVKGMDRGMDFCGLNKMGSTTFDKVDCGSVSSGFFRLHIDL